MVAITWDGWAVCFLAVKFYLIPRSILFEASEKLLLHFLLTGINWYSWGEILPVLMPNVVFISLRWWVDKISTKCYYAIFGGLLNHLGYRQSGLFVSKEMTTGNNALHSSYILKRVKILQDFLIEFAIGPTVNALGAFLMKSGASSHSLEYCNQYTVSFSVSINKLNSSGNFCHGTTFPIMLGIILNS